MRKIENNGCAFKVHNFTQLNHRLINFSALYNYALDLNFSDEEIL